MHGVPVSFRASTALRSGLHHCRLEQEDYNIVLHANGYLLLWKPRCYQVLTVFTVQREWLHVFLLKDWKHERLKMSCLG